MCKSRRYSGFSLIEVLMAVGTLAVGMIFIGGTFLVGIHFSTVSAERSTATVVANEAFAKIKIFGVSLRDPNLLIMNRQSSFPREVRSTRWMSSREFAYPSTRTSTGKHYFWSALCRRDPNDPFRGLLVTVFVSRKVGPVTRYRDRDRRPALWPLLIEVPYPKAVDVRVEHDPARPYEISIIDLDPSDGVDETTFINNGYTIVEDTTGQIYRVVERVIGVSGAADTLILDKAWNPLIYPDPDLVWVVPPPIGRGKGPCIEVYQKEMRF